MSEGKVIDLAIPESYGTAFYDAVRGIPASLLLSTVKRCEIAHELRNLLDDKLVRGWHYTRLLPFEISKIQSDGIVVSTRESMRRRLTALVENNIIDVKAVSCIVESSPLNEETQIRSRSGKFWFVTGCLSPKHPGVKNLLEHWGGEVIYQHLTNSNVIGLLKQIGKPTVLELQVPARLLGNPQRMLESMLNRVSQESSNRDYPDLYLVHDVDSSSVKSVFTSDTKEFEMLGDIS